MIKAAVVGLLCSLILVSHGQGQCGKRYPMKLHVCSQGEHRAGPILIFCKFFPENINPLQTDNCLHMESRVWRLGQPALVFREGKIRKPNSDLFSFPSLDILAELMFRTAFRGEIGLSSPMIIPQIARLKADDKPPGRRVAGVCNIHRDYWVKEPGFYTKRSDAFDRKVGSDLRFTDGLSGRVNVSGRIQGLLQKHNSDKTNESGQNTKERHRPLRNRIAGLYEAIPAIPGVLMLLGVFFLWAGALFWLGRFIWRNADGSGVRLLFGGLGALGTVLAGFALIFGWPIWLALLGF